MVKKKKKIETATTFPELLPISYVAEIFLDGETVTLNSPPVFPFCRGVCKKNGWQEKKREENEEKKKKNKKKKLKNRRKKEEN